MPTFYPDEEDGNVQRRRAGLRADELLPGESNDGSQTDRSAIGTAGGGFASGGLAGTNAGDGATSDVDLEEAMAKGIYDDSIDPEELNEPESGPSGGAVGGTPAGKRSGRRLHDPAG